jgi:gliding motility-associated-like protein
MAKSRYALILSLLMCSAAAFCQPANDDCSTAAALCAEQPAAGDNTGAVGPPGQCNTDNVVWYTFTTNSVGGAAVVSVTDIDCPDVGGMDNELGAVVLSGDGSCSLAAFNVVAPGCEIDSVDFSLTTVALAPSTTYWITVGGTQNNGATQYSECAFNITASGPGVDVVDVDFDAGPDVDIALGGSTQLNAVGGTGHVWSPPSGLSGNMVPDPIAQPTETTIYTATAQVDGCTFSDQVTVAVVRLISPPNTFSPNGDGINDVWTIPGMQDYPQAAVRIFDRWGQRVYQSIGYREPFDGAGLPTATYYWHIDLNQLGGGATPYTGYITIIR